MIQLRGAASSAGRVTFVVTMDRTSTFAARPLALALTMARTSASLSRWLPVAAAIVLGSASSIGAQTDRTRHAAEPGRLPFQRSDGEPLTLGMALDAADRHDRGLSQAELSLAHQRLRTRWSLAAYLPALSASLGSTAFAATTVTGEDDFGRPRRLDSAIEYSGSASYQSIGATWALFDGGRRWSDYRQARAATHASLARVHTERARVKADATRLFYQTVRATLLLQFDRETLDAAIEQRTTTERLFSIAIASYADLLGATAQEADRRRQVRIAELALERARRQLALALGVPSTAIVRLDTVLPAVFDPRAMESASITSTIARHPALAAADADVAMAQQRLAAFEASMWPQVNLGASVARSVSLSSDAALGVLDPRNRSYSLGITVSLPVFSRFQGWVNRQEAALELEHTRISRLRAGEAVQSDIDDAWLALHEAWERAQGADESVRLQRERAEMVARLHATGAVSFPELQGTVDRAIAAEREVRESRITFAVALAVLEQRTGASPALAAFGSRRPRRMPVDQQTGTSLPSSELTRQEGSPHGQ